MAGRWWLIRFVLIATLLVSLYCGILTDSVRTEAFQQLPAVERGSLWTIPFIARSGPPDDSIACTTNIRGGLVLIGRDASITYAIGTETDSGFFREHFINADITSVKATNLSATRVNWFKGNNPAGWKTNVPTSSRVNLGTLYPGIDVELLSTGGNVEKLFRVQPSADPARIRIGVGPETTLRITESGELLATSSRGKLMFTKPVAYQEADGGRVYVEAGYCVNNDAYGFSLGDYDRSKTLVIDPLIASSFLGGSELETCGALAIGADGSVYIAGSTGSLDLADGINHLSGDSDLFIARFDSDLENLLSIAYVGGSGEETAEAWHYLKLDRDGNVLITGSTDSPDFPVSANSFDSDYNGGVDAFLVKLNSDLNTLLASTYLGGSDDDKPLSLYISDGEKPYITGETSSPDFVTTTDAYDRVHNGEIDAFVAGFSADLSLLNASTLIGSPADDRCYAMTSTSSGRLYFSGISYSAEFPSTDGAFSESYNGGSRDVVLFVMDKNLSNLVISTFFGGSDWEFAPGIDIDADGNILIAGETRSEDLPTTAEAFDRSWNAHEEAFAAIFDPDLKSLIACTYIGGDVMDGFASIQFDRDGRIILGGFSLSSDFPTTPGAMCPEQIGSIDSVISVFSPDLKTLVASTYLGGSSHETRAIVALDNDGFLYVAGATSSSDFPVTPGAYSDSFGGYVDYFGGDAYVLKTSLTLASSGCDLSVRKLRFNPKKPEPGEALTLKCKVVNGSGVVSAPTDLSVYLCPKRKINNRSILLGTIPVKALNPGRKQTIKAVVSMPTVVKRNAYFLAVEVDKPNVNADDSRNNNQQFSAAKLVLR